MTVLRTRLIALLAAQREPDYCVCCEIVCARYAATLAEHQWSAPESCSCGDTVFPGERDAHQADAILAAHQGEIA